MRPAEIALTGILEDIAIDQAQRVKMLEPLLQSARDLHAYHAAQRQVSRAPGESLACPCAICVAVEQLDRA